MSLRCQVICHTFCPHPVPPPWPRTHPISYPKYESNFLMDLPNPDAIPSYPLPSTSYGTFKNVPLGTPGWLSW